MILDILSNDEELVSKALEKAILNDRNSKDKKRAREGLDYYKGKHEILNFRLFYFDSNGVLKEDKYKSNIKIQHQFHTELVDQKVQYLLSNPVEVVSADEKCQEKLREYINENFQETLQNALEGASNKAYEYIYAYKDENNKISFQIADSLGVISVNDGDIERAIIRYYDTQVQNYKGEEITITKAEVWTDKEVVYYKQSEDKKIYELDNSISPNPKPHILLEDESYIYGESLGYIPFFRLDNNRYQSTDLEPIKALVDDYDIMACSLSNNLQDFQEAIYVVRGYPGDDLDSLAKNLKTKKTIGVDSEGGIDIKTIDIPVEARRTKLELDKSAIYKFGMGFDSNEVGDGNITNVVIKSRYSLLDLKCNKAEIRLRKLIRQLLKVVVDDINMRYGTSYNHSDLQINISRKIMVNEDSTVNNSKIEADTKGVLINNILSTGEVISNETKLKLICDILELNFEEERKSLENQETSVDMKEISSNLQNKTNENKDEEISRI